MSRGKLLFFIFWTAFATRAFAVEQDTNKLVDQIDLAISLQDRYPDSALAIARHVYSASQKIGFVRGVSYGSLRIGHVLYLKGRNDSAICYIKKSLGLRKQLKDYVGASHAALVLGSIYKNTGKLDSSFASITQSVRLAEKSDDTSWVIFSLLELGHITVDLQGPKNARTHYEEANLLGRLYNGPYETANVFSGFGKFHFSQEHYDSSLSCYQRASHIFDSLGLLQDQAIADNNIALCYSNLKSFPKAIDHFNQAMSVYQSLEMEEDVALAFFNIGSIYHQLEQSDSAIVNLEKSIGIAQDLGDVHRLTECYELLSEVYAGLGNHSLAYSNHLKYSELNDSLLNVEKISSMAEMQTKYQTEKKEQRIALLDQENQTKKAQQRLLLAGVGLLSLSLFVLGFYYVQRNRIAKQNAVIAQQKIEGLLDEQEIKTYNAMLEGQEEERMRISTDLHDRLGSMLSTIKLMFSALGDKIDKAQEENKTQYEKANSLIDTACIEVRRISHNLGAGMVANFGLVKSLEELCESIDQTGKISCSLTSHNMEQGFPLHIEIEIYRIAQEAVNNAIKHAEANTVSIQLSRLENELNMHVEDNGLGFDVTKTTGGLGLESLKTRAEKVGGTVHIDSFIGRGTTVILEIPLEEL